MLSTLKKYNNKTVLVTGHTGFKGSWLVMCLLKLNAKVIGISKDIKKTISSAISNAENNYQYDIDSLFVKEAFCGKQITMKRFRARAKGRAAEIMKPYSNITIILREKVKEESKHGSKG